MRENVPQQNEHHPTRHRGYQIQKAHSPSNSTASHERAAVVSSRLAPVLGNQAPNGGQVFNRHDTPKGGSDVQCMLFTARAETTVHRATASNDTTTV
jgi:hypothetical protein